MTKVRTRFAPSPTGRMHVGNLRTALYEFLIAKHAGGDFILRIEDTDRERLVEGAVDIIYRTMAETGLVHDEGPDKDKGFGPYVQSERQASGLYLEYAKKLIESGDAYYCFCDKERLESLKTSVGEDGKEITVYDKHCLHLSKEEIQANLDAGKPYVIRINMPTEGTTTFVDELYGEITVENKELDDMILIKSDGYPTYNFANVVDDHLQQITHVVRGNEYISSSPKYQRLYEAFGWEPPKYVHLPLITDENHKKLSKRSGHASYEDLIEQGFLPEAVVNYLALLGWSPEDNREIFSLDELIKEFDYHKVNKSPSVFDIQKLKWMNGEYIKAMDNEKFYEKVKDVIIYKDIDGKYLTLDEYLDGKEEKDVYYVSDPQTQSQYINMFKNQGLNAVVLPSMMDTHFISLVEMKQTGVKFKRIDSAINDISDNTEKDDSAKEQEKKLIEKFKNEIKDDTLKIEVQSLKDDSIPAVILLGEQSRRMQEMYKAYGQQMAGMADMFHDEFTLVLNSNNSLIKKIDTLNDEDANLVIDHVYDLAKISHSPLPAEQMTKFIERSNKLLEKLF